MIINYFLVRTFIFFIIFWYLQYMPQNLFLKQPCRDIYLSVVFYMMWILLQLLYCRMCLSATYQKTKFLPWVKLLVWFSWAAATILVCCAGLITLCVCVCVCAPGSELWWTCCATSPALCSRTRGTTAWRWRWQTDRGAGPWDAPRRTTMPPAACPARTTDVSADLWWERMKWCLIS